MGKVLLGLQMSCEKQGLAVSYFSEENLGILITAAIIQILTQPSKVLLD